MVKHNNVVPNVHLRKHWQLRVKTFFDQPAQKRRRIERRAARANLIAPRPLEKLRPVCRGQTVRYNRTKKLGRGFSFLELKEAKISPEFAKSIGITVDHRRQNRCSEGLQQNVERLKAYVQKLVLFPLSSKRLAKGPIPDTKDADKVAANASVEDVLPLRQDKKRVKAVASSEIAKLQKVKVYRTIRQEWVNKHWKGKREKRAADEAAKEKK